MAPAQTKTASIPQPPGFIADAVVWLVIYSLYTMQRRLASRVFARVPASVWPLVAWLCGSVCMADTGLVRRVLKKVMPLLEHWLNDVHWSAVPLGAQVGVWCVFTGLCWWYAWRQHADGPVDAPTRARALAYLDGLYRTGFLMEDERAGLRADVQNPAHTRVQLVERVQTRLRAITVCGAGALEDPTCGAMVDVILDRPSSSADRGPPAPVSSGPLQELADVELVGQEEALRVWLVAGDRNPRARYVPFASIRGALKAHFDRRCKKFSADRGLTVGDFDFMRDTVLVRRLLRSDPLEPGLGLRLGQFKKLWRWYYELVAALNSCSSLRTAWNNNLIAGCVDRGKAQTMLGDGAGRILFRFSVEQHSERFALAASYVMPGGAIKHVQVLVRPQQVDRFLVPTEMMDGDGERNFVTKRFAAFQNLFATYTNWKTLVPAGVSVAAGFPTVSSGGGAKTKTMGKK